MNLKDRIKRHEGKRNKPYRDSLGILTVGYGRNLEAVSFTDREIDVMFDTDFARASIDAEYFDAYQKMNEARRGVLIEMCFQMGRNRVAKFKRFLEAAERQDWDSAANEMLDSEWSRQTPQRALELSEIFRSGIVDSA